jgi:hypothetical protein
MRTALSLYIAADRSREWCVVAVARNSLSANNIDKLDTIDTPRATPA